MKEMNRRAFLTLTGASVALLALAACGSTPSTPVVPTTGKEAKVLEAINKYRGALPPLTPDSGLDPAMKLVVKIAKGEMKYDEKAAEALGKAIVGYNEVGAPIGIAFDKDTGYMMPVCVYSDSAEQMEQNLLLLGDESGKASLSSPAIKLVNIKTFEYKGTTFWVAVVAEGKK